MLDLPMQRIQVTLFLLLCQAMYSRPALAEAPVSAFSGEYVRLLVLDTAHTLTAPARWGREEWGDFSLLTAGVGAVMLFDKPVYEEIQRNRTASMDDFAKVAESAGSYPSFGIMGAFYAGGLLLDDTRAKAVAMDAFAASLAGAGVITTSLKVAAGRRRPNEEEEAYHFKPFGGDHSFPSGHTAQAFSLASVIAEHYDERWIDIASYGIATLVGLARVEQGAHFPSDVVAGAVIGTVVGKGIVRYNKERHAHVTVTPVADGQAMGVSLTVEF